MDASFNIVNLIEKNPIIKLSHNYNNKLINNIKEEFTEIQQKLFVSSFYCYLNYHPTSDFVIDLDNVWGWLGFSQKAHAKTCLEKFFVIEKDYKVLLSQSREQKNDTRGGHNKQIIMLNIHTFKLFCIKAGTQKANEIHEYFVKLEDMLHQIVQEECQELKQQLEDANKTMDKKLLEQKTQQKQEILLKKYSSPISLVYVIKVKTYENGDYIVKIGESRNGVESRYKEHKKNYEECILLDCYEVNRSKQFEHFLHHHEKIHPNKVKDLPKHEKENELFKINNTLTYMQLCKIITDNINKFNEWSVNDIVEIIREENKNLLEQIVKSKIPINVTTSNTQFNTDIFQKLLQKIENLENQNKQLLEYINKPQIKTVTNFNTPLATLGPRLQKINPETGILVRLYESAAECIKESKGNINRQSLVNAINYNTIYRGYRWMFVDRDIADPTIIINYQPTKITRLQNIDYVAKLDANKTKILNVYLNRKIAAIENGYKSHSALDEPVKTGKMTNGFFYILYNNCDDHLRKLFEEQNGEPILYKDGIGQFDSEQKLVKEFTTKEQCCKQLQISDKTLRKSLDNETMYNNYYYKKMGSKLKILL